VVWQESKQGFQANTGLTVSP